MKFCLSQATAVAICWLGEPTVTLTPIHRIFAPGYQPYEETMKLKIDTYAFNRSGPNLCAGSMRNSSSKKRPKE